MRKPAFCICENKDADQLRDNHEADQRLCFRYTDSTIPLLPKSEISRVQPSSVVVQPGLCRTWSGTPKTGFLTTRLNLSFRIVKNHVILPSIAFGVCSGGTWQGISIFLDWVGHFLIITSGVACS